MCMYAVQNLVSLTICKVQSKNLFRLDSSGFCFPLLFLPKYFQNHRKWGFYFLVYILNLTFSPFLAILIIFLLFILKQSLT